MTDRELISRLGGGRTLHEALLKSLAEQAPPLEDVFVWASRNRIPADYRYYVRIALEAHGVDVPVDFLKPMKRVAK